MKKAVLSAKLTKTVLLNLPEGHYLASNCMLTPIQPIFAQTIRPAAQRAAQWREIVAARANGRLCYVFETSANYQASAVQRVLPVRVDLN
jgi:hypothetical protein